MATNRAISIIALILSLVAIALSARTIERDPLGTDLSNYDLSSPEQTLRSINKIVTKQDIRAALQFLTSEIQNQGEDKDTKLFLSDGITLTVLKSVEMSNSGNSKNNGLVVSFVKFTVSGVDYYTVKYFRKDQSNRFQLAEKVGPFGAERTESDNNLDAAIEAFERTGKLN